MELYHTIEINEFFHELVKIEIIQEALTGSLGKDIAQGLIQELSSGLHCGNIKVDFEDIITDCVDNNSIIFKTLTGNGDFGEFPIQIFQFGPLFWVSAQEFDSIKYFKSANDAIACAEFEYDSFF